MEQENKTNCSVDLKLGRLSGFGESSSYDCKNARTMLIGSPSRVSRHGRMPSNKSQISSCLVDGCKSDLSNCREYHRRHKVCEVHAKTPIVMVGGQQQRFCQQCSRFHLLMEFDEVKRSCRKRLDGHNRRRRKQPPQPLSLHSGSLHLSHQGSNLSIYGSPEMLLNASSDPKWSRFTRAEDLRNLHHLPLHVFSGKYSSPASFPDDYEGRSFSPFLHESNTSPALGNIKILDASAHVSPGAIALPESSSGSELFADRVSHLFDSDCALSLLSSPTEVSRSSLDSIAANHIHMIQPMDINIRCDGMYCSSEQTNNVPSTGFSTEGIVADPASTVAISGENFTDIQCHGIFQITGERAYASEASRRHPFSW